MVWLNHFLTNTDILHDVHLRHQQCRLPRTPQRSTCVPRDVLPLSTAMRCFPRVMTQFSHMPIVTTLSWKFGAPGYTRTAVKNGPISPVAKAMPHAWQSSMRLMPPGTQMFLTTERLGTNWAPLPFQTRGRPQLALIMDLVTTSNCPLTFVVCHYSYTCCRWKVIYPHFVFIYAIFVLIIVFTHCNH